ncbi:actin filament-associated protein 1-like 1 [Lates japonicus]|uniref:Actin filament-associated protein 1-like 1 n=1 Tax=Lates japonicus TaxID=270547 RepID=A0AAD3RJU4_LATJO|nr:actin filament-associated protein 1-like 1 [Lates japonicus]
MPQPVYRPRDLEPKDMRERERQGECSRYDILPVRFLRLSPTDIIGSEFGQSAVHLGRQIELAQLWRPVALKILAAGSCVVCRTERHSPEELHYLLTSTRDTPQTFVYAARHSFLWPPRPSPLLQQPHRPRTYDEVYESVAVETPCSFLQQGPEKTEQQATIKRHASNVNQYGRYGKTRAEEDARRYLTQKEELEKQKEELRNALISLRREKKEVKEKMKSGTGHDMEQRLAGAGDAINSRRRRTGWSWSLTDVEVKENGRSHWPEEHVPRYRRSVSR